MSDLESFIEGHLGCGNPGSQVWFIGAEPAGTGTLEDVQARVNSFVKQGSIPVTNLRQDLIEMGETKWFDGKSPPTQPYWRRVSHLFLAAQGAKDDQLTTEAFRTFQKDVLLGVLTLGPLLLETSSLPAKSTKHWTYADWGIAKLESRKKYFNEVIPDRMRRINQLIEEHEPRVVLCCGTTYNDRWVHLKRRAGTKIRVIPHPTAHGVTHEQWTKLGRELTEHL